MLVWREEQKPAELGSEEVVVMPHNCAGAESIRLAFLLIAIECDDELHPFQRVPSASIQTGNIISIRGAATIFGPLTVTLSVPDKKILIRVKPLTGSCEGFFILGRSRPAEVCRRPGGSATNRDWTKVHVPVKCSLPSP